MLCYYLELFLCAEHYFSSTVNLIKLNNWTTSATLTGHTFSTWTSFLFFSFFKGKALAAWEGNELSAIKLWVIPNVRPLDFLTEPSQISVLHIVTCSSSSRQACEGARLQGYKLLIDEPQYFYIYFCVMIRFNIYNLHDLSNV